MNKIHTDRAPAAVGPYSQAIKINGMVFTSGQIALDPATGDIVGTDIKTQTHQVMKNLMEVLKAAGTEQKNTVKTTCFLSNMDDFAAFNEIYAQYFTEAPARSCVAVKALPKNVLCEVEAIAIAED